MSQLQRVIVRSGLEANIPALHTAELGWDIDTKTLRVGDESHDPVKILTTKSTGDFDFTSANSVKFKHLIVDTLAGANIASMYGEAPGFVVAVDSQGNFRNSKIISSDGSVSVTNGTGESGEVDLRVSTETIGNALDDIRQALAEIVDQIGDLDQDLQSEKQKIANLILLSGRPANAAHLGLFNGNIIPANVSVKTALQQLANELQDLQDVVAGEDLSLQIFGLTSTQFTLALSNGSEVTVPAVDALDDKAGLMLSEDKRKLDFIGVTEAIDLDVIPDRIADTELSISSLQSVTEDLDTRVTALEDAVDDRIPSFYKKLADLLWESVVPDTAGVFYSNTSFIIEVDRIGTTDASYQYSNVTLNGIDILPTDHPTHTTTVSILVIRKSAIWYFTIGNSIVAELESDPANAQRFDINAGDNSVRVFQAQGI